MKLHLPCALRGALFACFALACTSPTQADDLVVTSNDIVVTGNEDSIYIRPGSADSYDIRPLNTGSSIRVGTLNVTESTTINIGYTSTEFSGFTIENIMVADGATLTVKVSGVASLVYLNNINFTGNVNFVLEDGAKLFISASDCLANSVSGEGTVYFTGGTLDATRATISSDLSSWLTAGPYAAGGLQPSDLTELAGPCTVAGSNISYDIYPGATIHVNTPGRKGGDIENSSTGYMLDWKGVNGYEKVEPDASSVIIDPEGNYRTGTAGSKAWYLQRDVSVQELQSGKLGDKTDLQWVKLESTDGLHFMGATLSSSANVTIGGPITGGTYETTSDDGLTTYTHRHIIKLAPAAGTTMVFLNGAGALENNPLELSGGDGSRVELWGVTNDNPGRITFTTANTTLGIAGPGTLTLDSSKVQMLSDGTTKTDDAGNPLYSNVFLPTSHLSKLDGGTLVYIGKTTDAIGSLNNTAGTVQLGNKTELTVGAVNADVFTIAKQGTRLTAGTLNVGEFNTGNSFNEITIVTVDALNSTRMVNVGDYSRLTVGSMTAQDITLAHDAQLTISALATGGVTSLNGKDAGNAYSNSAKVMLGAITLSAPDAATATITNLAFSGSALRSASMTDAVIDVAAAKSRAAGASLTLGTVDNTTITTVAGTTIADTSFSNSSVTATDNLTLNGTTHGADTSIVITGTGSSVSFTGDLIWSGSTAVIDGGATIQQGGSITVDGNTIEVTSLPQQVTLVGTANAGGMTINALFVDLTGQSVPTTEQDPTSAAAPVILTSTSGSIVKGSDYYFDYISDPGMVPYENISGDQVTYVLKDESDKILDKLKTSANVTPAATVLADYGMNGGQGVLFDLFNYLRDTSRATFERRQAALESVVSGSLTMLADSQRRNVVNTVNTIRNRVIQMGNEQNIEMEKNIHAWIEADGFFNDVDQDGPYAGYEYQTWGGTVGAHADVGNFSFGAAVSASYGDLTAHSTDRAEGDHDAVTLSAFVRHQHGGWTQMGILSLSRNEVEMQRSITAEKNPGKGESLSYSGKGDASGHTITGYYEAGYTFTLGEEGTQVLQPLVSIMLTSARMGDFTETGSIGNAGLCSDTVDYFYGTVGIGARYQIVLGSNVEGRLCFAEARAKVVQDFGDETNETTAFFAAVPGQSFTVKGADVGRTGFQIGAGISVPVGVYTTLFVDADADIRSGATSYGGNVGIRVQF